MSKTLYIRYLLKNIEPLRITDASISQNGQIDTLTYIPGMTMRGVVINTLAEKLDKKAEWPKIVRKLFSDQVSYLNAYPMGEKDGKQVELLPSPKGFYEDKVEKQEKNLQNVLVNGTIEGGHKRASLGRYCYMDVNNKNILFCSVELGSDMRINTGSHEQEKNMFRSQYIAQNQIFCGYIAVKDRELCELIQSVFDRKYLLIGNGRLAGMGKCEIAEVKETEELSYESYSIQSAKEKECYLYLVSNTVMCNENGEITGLDIPTLEKQLGVEQLEICLCATSMVKNNGYSRIWDARLPETVMYEMGSVFKLNYKGTLEKERAVRVLSEGIGIRRNEGFGRILILDCYEELQFKQKLDKGRDKSKTETEKGFIKKETVEKKLTEEEEQVLLIAARGYYLEKLELAKKSYLVSQKNHPILNRKLASSQMGTIESYAASLQYTPELAKKELLGYLKHAVEKDEAQRTHRKRQKRDEVKEFIEKLLESDLEQVLDISLNKSIMGIEKRRLLTEEETLRWKLRFLIDMIRYANKEEE